MTLTQAALLEIVAPEAVKATLVATAGPGTPPTPPVAPTAATPTPAQQQREDLEMAVHESGHAIAGVIYGATLRSSVVVRSRVTGLEGLTRFEPEDFPAHRNTEIAYGGSYGQAKFRAVGGRPTAQQLYAVLDSTGCKDAASLSLAGGAHLGHDVKPIIDRAWPAVLTVAEQLYRTGQVRHADVCAALGITDGGGYTSGQLASLRSGGRVVPPFSPKKKAPQPT